MYTFVWFSGAIWETPSKKTAVILSHLYVIGVKIVLRAYSNKLNKQGSETYLKPVIASMHGCTVWPARPFRSDPINVPPNRVWFRCLDEGYRSHTRLADGW